MRHIVVCKITLLALGGCVLAPEPNLNADGYHRVPIPSGCYGHELDRNVQLTIALEQSLLSLLQESEGAGKCWYERGDGSLLLTIDDECGPHQEVEFRRVYENWTVVEERDVPVVTCDVRAP